MDKIKRLAIYHSNLIEQIDDSSSLGQAHYKAAELAEISAREKTLLHPKVIHWVLFNEAGVSKPGQYRDCFVRVGLHVPPAPKDLPRLMEEWWDQAIDEFFATASLEAWAFHASFETIHPFEDGNGRVGRILWWSLLETLEEPIEIIEYKDRFKYYDRLEDWRKVNHGV